MIKMARMQKRNSILEIVCIRTHSETLHSYERINKSINYSFRMANMCFFCRNGCYILCARLLNSLSHTHRQCYPFTSAPPIPVQFSLQPAIYSSITLAVS